MRHDGSRPGETCGRASSNLPPAGKTRSPDRLVDGEAGGQGAGGACLGWGHPEVVWSRSGELVNGLAAVASAPSAGLFPACRPASRARFMLGPPGCERCRR